MNEDGEFAEIEDNLGPWDKVDEAQERRRSKLLKSIWSTIFHIRIEEGPGNGAFSDYLPFIQAQTEYERLKWQKGSARDAADRKLNEISHELLFSKYNQELGDIAQYVTALSVCPRGS